MLLRCAARSKEQPTAYLEGRGIIKMPPCAELIAPDDAKRLTGKRFPTMVVPIVNSVGLQGCQITWLNSNADAKLGVSDGDARLTFGHLSGGYVPLARLILTAL